MERLNMEEIVDIVYRLRKGESQRTAAASLRLGSAPATRWCNHIANLPGPVEHRALFAYGRRAY